MLIIQLEHPYCLFLLADLYTIFPGFLAVAVIYRPVTISINFFLFFWGGAILDAVSPRAYELTQESKK